jgi:transcriptional regulator with XRE-family HTH domain
MSEQEKQLYFNLRRNKKIRLKHIANYLNCSISLLSRYERENINMDERKIIGYKNFITNYTLEEV